jgi:hypothetical protein
MFFYIYRKARKSSYLTEIIAEIHIMDILKLKILIAIDIINIEKIFINFRIRTLAIDTISEFSTNIRVIRRNIKMIKTVVNSRKEEIIPPNAIKEIPIRMRKKLDRGIETMNIAIMEYKGSPPYVQRMIDTILRPHRQFARCYVDDIVDGGCCTLIELMGQQTRYMDRVT